MNEVITNDEQLAKVDQRIDALRRERRRALNVNDLVELGRIDKELGEWLMAVRKYKTHQG